mgnify:CR=1 FL=1
MNVVTDVTGSNINDCKDNTLYLINAPYGATANTYFSIDTKQEMKQKFNRSTC